MAPSPKKTTTIFLVFFCLIDKAAPTAIGMVLPTIGVDATKQHQDQEPKQDPLTS